MKERLQKIISRAGVASRRKAEKLIESGRVTVNGKVVTELGSKADLQEDHIKVNGRLLTPEPYVYVVLNKPAGVISSREDPEGRPVVTDFVRVKGRIYPAGRLDYDSEGLIILTNDGELAQTLTEAGSVPKRYRVKVGGKPTEQVIERLRKGIRLEEGEVLAPCFIRLLKSENNTWYEVVLKQGRNRQIRRMFEAVGHRVMRLKRVKIGPVDIRGLKKGQWRHLAPHELRQLKGMQS